MNILDQLTDDSLVRLVQTGNEVGRIYSIDYENALVLTNDFWKKKVNGVPQNAFLIATNIIPEDYSNQDDFDKEIILLRVIGSCKLPHDDDNIRTKLDAIQDSSSFTADRTSGFDKITQNMLQFSGLQCRVLGTFYMKNQELQLGSDIENFSASLTQKVYMPKGSALETIANYVDPIRKNKSKADFKALGIKTDVEPFKIGTVRYYIIPYRKSNAPLASIRRKDGTTPKNILSGLQTKVTRKSGGILRKCASPRFTVGNAASC